jgi:hypothetical protein
MNTGGDMRMSSLFKLLFVTLLVLAVGIPVLYAQEPIPNQKPCMYEGTIEPQSGTARTAYIASVHYYDPDGKKPVKIQVFVDDVSYSLKRASGKFNDGIYRCRLTLPPGEHTYYFYGEDDMGREVRMPRYGVKKGPAVSLTKPWIKPAKLSDAGLFQKAGNDKMTYTYTIHYCDPQDKPPQKLYVVVDGIMYPMTLHKGKAYDGSYIAILNLPAGHHAYYFKALDMLGNCISLPEEGFVRGPEVTENMNSSPRLFDVYLDPIIGYKSTKFNYHVTYLDDDFDSPSILKIVIDGESYPLRLKSGKTYNGIYTFSAKQYIGNYHNYYFYCEDGRGGSCRIPETGTYHGPVVVK